MSGFFDNAVDTVNKATGPPQVAAVASKRRAPGTPQFVIPPAPAKTPTSPRKAFNDFINAHPNMRGYADTIYKWAGRSGVDPVVLAALYWRESFAEAKRLGKDPATIVSPAGAVGIGQMIDGKDFSWIGKKAPWGETITREFMENPEKNIRWSAAYFAKAQDTYGTPDAAYSRGYNPHYNGPPLTDLLPKGYVIQSGLSPTDKASVAAENTQAKTADPNYIGATSDLSIAKKADKAWKTDPWVTVDSHGHIQHVASPTPPKNALKYGGQPITVSDFQKVWTQGYADTFEAYTGRQPTGPEIKKILAEGVTAYTLAVRLAQSKDFPNSSTYKQHAPGLALYVKEKLGRKPNAQMLGRMIGGNWDSATVDAWIKSQPGYTDGPEYKAALTNLRPVYEQIMGKPDNRGEAFLHDAAVNGWTQDALAQKLRDDPAYKYSPEYQAKTLNFLDAMGMFIGARPVLHPDAAAKQVKQPKLPLHLDTGGALTPTVPFAASLKAGAPVKVKAPVSVPEAAAHAIVDKAVAYTKLPASYRKLRGGG